MDKNKESKKMVTRIIDDSRHYLGEIVEDGCYIYCHRCKKLVLAHKRIK
jgi:hypothetical protein